MVVHFRCVVVIRYGTRRPCQLPPLSRIADSSRGLSVGSRGAFHGNSNRKITIAHFERNNWVASTLLPTRNDLRCCWLSSSSSSSSFKSSSKYITASSPPREQPSKEKDFKKWERISKDLIQQQAPWSQTDLRMVEQCLLHWSLQYPPLNASMWKDTRRNNNHTLVQLWKRLVVTHTTTEQDISRAMYDYAVHALARWGFPVLAEECLQDFIRYIDSFSTTFRLNAPAKFHTKSISRSYESLEQPEECEAYLRRCLAHPRTAKLVDPRTVQRALIAWRNAGNGERAEALLNWVGREHQQHVKLAIDCYSTVCLAWGRTKGRNDAGVRAEKFVKEMAIPPDPICWSGVLMAWTNVPTQPEGLHHAESLLWQLVQERAPLSSYCFNEILNAYGRLGMADRALEFLERWIHDATQTRRHPLDDSLTPTVQSFNCVIRALATAGSSDAGEKAHALMKDMQEKYHMTPDSYTYNSVMAAYAKTGNTDAVEALLDHLESTNGKDIPLYDVSQRLYGYTSLIQAWSERSSSSSADQRLPYAIKATAVLDRMVAQGLTPPPVAYSIVLNVFTYCDSEEAANAAEDLLNWMDREGIPYTEEYGVKVLNAWARIGMPHRAHALLKKMEKQQIKNKQMTCAWYNCVIMAYSRNPEPENAEAATALLTQLESSDHLPDPDGITYKLTLSCWLRSRHHDKASRAWDVLQQFLSNFDNIRKATQRETDSEQLVMDAHVVVLLTCAGVPLEAGEERRQLALNIALQAFSQIPQRDSRVYYAALKAFGNMMRETPDERYALIRNIYLEYLNRYQDGDERVAKLLADMLPADMYSELMNAKPGDQPVSSSETS